MTMSIYVQNTDPHAEDRHLLRVVVVLISMLPYPKVGEVGSCQPLSNMGDVDSALLQIQRWS